MPKTLTHDDIVGRCLHQIMQTYEPLKEEADFALHYFILDSDIAFLLPQRIILPPPSPLP